ncbi:MAG: hypothetical protein R3Y24_16825 [Eubacteriales bacterium]
MHQPLLTKKNIINMSITLITLIVGIIIYQMTKSKVTVIWMAFMIAIPCIASVKPITRNQIIELGISVTLLFITYLIIKMYFINTALILPIYCLGTSINIWICFSVEKSKKIWENIYIYRYLIALIIFILCVVLQLHGSSMNQYNLFFNDLPEYEGILFGTYRSIRSDEYTVQLPYYFSQYYNNYGLISNQMSISGQDMLVGYNAPIMNFTALSKPFTWGYILFGNTYGLSWYWCSKTILCLLVAFELCMLITNRSKIMSFVASIALVFSPMMQWWFSPHMYDVFFWAMSLCVVGYYFFMSEGKWKWFFTVLAPIVAFGFIIALFPSLQIAGGLVVASLLVGFLVRDKKGLYFSRLDVIRLIIAVIILVALLVGVVITSYEAIELLNSTVYPGARIETGGNGTLSNLFSDLTCFVTPFKDTNVWNNCEISTFNHLGVLVLISYPYLYWKRTKESSKDLIVGGILWVAMIIQVEFMLLGMPELLAKVTLFSYINRMSIAYGFTATLATVWFIYYCIKYQKLHKSYILAGFSVLFMLLYASAITPANLEFMNGQFYGLMILIFAGTFILSVYGKKYIVVAVILMLTIISGCLVNPIVRGTSAIYGHSISEKITEYVEENDGYWIATDSIINQNFLLANGAKVLNAVNFYPDIEKWNIIDSEGTYIDYFNRYAHMTFVLTEEETTITLISADLIKVNLNVNQLESLGTKYILSNQDYVELFEKNNLNYVKIYTDETGYHVYSNPDL